MLTALLRILCLALLPALHASEPLPGEGPLPLPDPPQPHTAWLQPLLPDAVRCARDHLPRPPALPDLDALTIHITLVEGQLVDAALTLHGERHAATTACLQDAWRGQHPTPLPPEQATSEIRLRWPRR